MVQRLDVPSSSKSDKQTATSPTSSIGAGIRRKLVVVGDGSAGKTSLLFAYTSGGKKLSDIYLPTVFENTNAQIIVDNHVVEMGLWDTAGQEEYDRLRPLSYPETDVVLICFSLDMPSSLASVTLKWIEEILLYCEGVPRILVGCKSDLRREQAECITYEQGLQVAEKIQAYKYIECSAKTLEGISQVFEHAARASLLVRNKAKIFKRWLMY